MAMYNDYGAGAISEAIGGLLKGLQAGQEVADKRQERAENQRYKEMELNARINADKTKSERDTKLAEATLNKEFEDRKVKLFTEGYDPSSLQKNEPADYTKVKYRPDFLSQNKNANQLVKDDPFSSDLRSKWLNNQTTKDTQTLSSNYAKIKSVAANPSAAGDLSLIFSYMKMLDPGSTVREGEFANAQNAAGIPDQIRNLYNRAKNGERLNEQQRGDFVNQSKTVYEAQLRNQDALNKSFLGVAKRRGLKGSDIVLEDMFDAGLLKDDGMLKDGLMKQQQNVAPKQASVIDQVSNFIFPQQLQSHPKDNNAVEWAKKNKNDPRALVILKANGL